MAREDQTRRLAVWGRLRRAQKARGRQSRSGSFAWCEVVVESAMALGCRMGLRRLRALSLVLCCSCEFVEALVVHLPTRVCRGEADNASFSCENTTAL